MPAYMYRLEDMECWFAKIAGKNCQTIMGFNNNFMNTCKKYNALPPECKQQIDVLIKKMKGKAHVSDIDIEESDLSDYDLKVTVCKYNSSGTKGWATIGYLKHDHSKGDIWRLSYQPKKNKGEKSQAGRTGSYC